MARTVCEDLAEWSRSASPQEACGLLLGPAGSGSPIVTRAVRLTNLDDRPDRFRIDPVEVVRAEAAARVDGLEPVGVWHSHPGRPAVPSLADRRGASGWASHLIVCVDTAGRCEFRAWRVSAGRWTERPFEWGG